MMLPCVVRLYMPVKSPAGAVPACEKKKHVSHYTNPHKVVNGYIRY